MLLLELNKLILCRHMQSNIRRKLSESGIALGTETSEKNDVDVSRLKPDRYVYYSFVTASRQGVVVLCFFLKVVWPCNCSL